MSKTLFALPFLAFTLIAAKDPPPPPPKPLVSLTAPVEVAADPANKWTLELSNGGKVVIQLRPDVAPQHVYRIQLLTTQGFYNGLAFHRVIPGFMAQGGDLKGSGEGGSTLPDLQAEFNDLPHMRGVASMARAEQPNSANSQFFIMLAPTFKLDHHYTAFGRVIEGMNSVDGIAVGEPPERPTRIVRASIGGPLPAPPVVVAAAPAPAPEAAPPATPPAAVPAATPATDTPAAPPAVEAPVPATADPAATPPQPAVDGPVQEAPTPQ
ncbi:peptidylprolyl isomerase [Sphingomonas sp.]|uniref:peptidylprolyl isomerase n=1 Tax=Sphingomonas sp. TaxID=28214 RepID=UPI0025FDA3E7|nr:peptidylprolyl isomerase [Sphingomonas sp.]